MYLEYDLYKKGRQSRNFGFLSAFTLDLRSSSGILEVCLVASPVSFILCKSKVTQTYIFKRHDNITFTFNNAF